MARYVALRLGQALPTLFIASVVAFLVIQASPGDPARTRLGREATEAQVAAERVRLGLDQPLPVRYAIWLADAARLDFGRSFKTGLPVVPTVADAFVYTLRLTAAAFLLAAVVGSALGILAALRRGGVVDVLVSGLAAIGLSLPSFVIGTLLILVFAVELRWLPPSGGGDRDESVVGTLRHLALPAIALAIPFAAVLARFIRGALIEAMSADHIRTARAKGLLPRTIVSRHALRNALLPVVTVAGIYTGALLAGAVVTETVFSYPGLGRLTVTSIFSRDYPVVQACLLLAAGVFLVVTLVVDILYGVADARVRPGGRAG